MKNIISLFCVALLLISCGSSQKVAAYKKRPSTVGKKNIPVSGTKPQQVIKYAKTYLGTPYKFGGTTKSGMDCSGLVFTSFKKINVNLPRVSYDMSKKGKAVNLRGIKPGDLVFFKTSKKSHKPVNHVGVVSKSSNGRIRFIHSSSSKGVIESSLDNPYWNKTFKFAKRIL